MAPRPGDAYNLIPGSSFHGSALRALRTQVSALRALRSGTYLTRLGLYPSWTAPPRPTLQLEKKSVPVNPPIQEIQVSD